MPDPKPTDEEIIQALDAWLNRQPVLFGADGRSLFYPVWVARNRLVEVIKELRRVQRPESVKVPRLNGPES